MIFIRSYYFEVVVKTIVFLSFFVISHFPHVHVTAIHRVNADVRPWLFHVSYVLQAMLHGLFFYLQFYSL